MLGKRKAICRPLILIVRAHSSNAMTATPDHEQTRSCRSESDPFTFLRTSCPVDHFESFLSVRSCSTYLCTGQKTVLVRIPFFRRAIRFETNSPSRAIRIYVSIKSGFTCISGTISPTFDYEVCILYIVVRELCRVPFIRSTHLCIVVDYDRSKKNKCDEKTQTR